MLLQLDRNKPLSEYARESIESTIPGMLLKELKRRCNPEEILIFGCGYSSFPIITTRYFDGSFVTAYDIDDDKIKRSLTSPIKNHQRLTYTSENPDKEFDAVLAMAVLHEDPRQLTSTMVSFSKPGSYVGVIDYDMVRVGMEEFFKCWSCIGGEGDELRELGKEETHRIHTSFGLDECVALMEGTDVLYRFAEAALVSPVSGTRHFIYLGQKS